MEVYTKAYEWCVNCKLDVSCCLQRSQSCFSVSILMIKAAVSKTRSNFAASTFSAIDNFVAAFSNFIMYTNFTNQT